MVWWSGCVCRLVFGRAAVAEAAVQAVQVVQLSMKSKIAVRAAARLGQALVSSSSRLMVAKSDSASALSQHCPVRPTDSRMPNSSARAANCWLVYWQPRSEWKITGRVGRRCRHAAVRASATRSVRRWSAVAQPTTRRR